MMSRQLMWQKQPPGYSGLASKIATEISTGCEQIAPEHLRDMNPVKHEKIPDKRHVLEVSL